MSWKTLQQQPAASAPPLYDIAAASQEPLPAADPTAAKLRQLAQQHEIRPDFVAKLQQLRGFSIVLLCDDSGSMATPCVDGAGRGANQDPYAPPRTRWTELRDYVRIAVDLASCFGAEGVDVRFLNRQGLRGVTDAAQVDILFALNPAGYTPIVPALNTILHDYRVELAEHPVLVILVTDGEPTDTAGRSNTAAFLHAVQTKPARLHLSIVACTDDEDAVGYLDRVDCSAPHVDVCDDYPSERKQVQAAQGGAGRFPFSFGDYLVKSMLGPIDPYFDQLDESPVTAGHQSDRHAHRQNCEFCVIS
ncbi:hypothetical protein BC828DRAFT_393064 [Blastocladiella britannica]|nr:hypothetical protein BC828DRAFT_393064 [Blastocladiella britannica]